MDNLNINKKVRGGGLNGKVKIFNSFLILLAVLLIPILILLVPTSTYAWDMAPNSNIVEAGGYDAILTVGGNSGVDGSLHTSGYRLLNNNRSRIRQNGVIDHLSIHVNNVTNITNYYIQIWRKNGATFDRIYQEDVLAQLTGLPATKNITPSTTWTVQEGDYIACGIVISGAGSNQWNVLIGQAANSAYFAYDATPSATNYNWSAQSPYTSILPVKVYMQAPQIVYIGDSIVAGHPANYSFIENSTTYSLSSSISYQFSLLHSATYQNMGIGSQTSTQIAARFTNDVVNLHPRMAIIEASANDDTSAEGAEAIFLANWTSMLDACVTNNIIPVVLLSTPFTARSNANWQIRSDWETHLVNLIATSYSSAIVVDSKPHIGQFRVGGDAGNYWDIQAIYDSGDGVHENVAGYTEIAQTIVDVLDSDIPVTTASPVGDTYNSAQSITLTPNKTATTYYTTDGSDPTEASPTYSSPIDILTNTTLKFFSENAIGNLEAVKTEIYVIDTVAPITTASPIGETYTSVQSVTLTAVDDNSGVATTYYTTDGTEPTTSSLVYSSPIEISETTTLKFFSVDNVGNSESVKTEEYIINTEAPVIPFIEKLNLENVILNQTYQSQQDNADLLFYLLPKQKSINDLYIKLIRNKKKHLNGFTKKNSYPGYLKLLSNIGTVKRAYQKNVNKHINFRVSVRYSKSKLNKTKIKEKNLRLFIKDRDGIWRGPYRIYQNKTTHTLKFKIRNYLVKIPKNPVPNPLDIKTKNRPFAPSFYFRTLKKIKFVIAEKNALSNSTNLETSDSQDFFFE
ncbi:MAG: chitobiase/beta-hexosaminidase C-terminal domain-containing protein [Patescibacteria group bacterium]|jgi:lysophospholipase L1-like esterase